MAAQQDDPSPRRPWVEIDLGALCDNYALIADAAPGASVAAVVKCDGYGLGASEISRTLAERSRASEFFVAYAREGVELREALRDVATDASIYVFNGPHEETIEAFDTAALTPVLNSLQQARLWARSTSNRPAAVHIDTGMNRLGAPISEAEAIAKIAGGRVELVMSHLACSDDPAHAMNETQRERFEAVAALFPNARRSLSASAGALMDPRYHYDLVRLGVALYGASPFNHDDERLKSVASLRAPVIQTRRLRAGETVGYGATFAAPRDMETATIAYGYGDGAPRSASNSADFDIAGARAPIVGRVSMDLITIDVSAIETPVRVGDVATFFGAQPRIFDAAAACGTIPYELLTGLGARVDRRYL